MDNAGDSGGNSSKGSVPPSIPPVARSPTPVITAALPPPVPGATPIPLSAAVPIPRTRSNEFIRSVTGEVTVQAAVDQLVGQVLDDRYRLVRKIGSGGMATVYQGEHMVLGRKVAVKVLHPQLASDEGFVRRFLNEGRAAGTLGHPNLIASTDIGTTSSGAPFLVLEYLEGTDLANFLGRNGALPPVRAARIGVQIASALAAAHQARIIHRDLKAENVFILHRNDRRDEVKVIDFGVSKFGASTGTTQHGVMIGTPQYMAPEQLVPPHHIDERTDVYALGVILFQMLTGQLPFRHPTIPGLVNQIITETPPDLVGLVPGIPAGLAHLVKMALSKDPEKRPGSMGALEEELSQFANLGSASLEMPLVQAPAPAPASRGPGIGMLVVSGVALLAIGALGAMLLRGKEPSPVAAPVVAAVVPAPPPPAPVPVVVAAPAVVVAEPVAAPMTIKLQVSSVIPKARVAFRGRLFTLPYEVELKPGDAPESLEITAPKFTGKRFWITLDQDRTLKVELKKGAGMVDAGQTETALALGEAPEEIIEDEAKAAVGRPARRAAEKAPAPVAIAGPAPTPAAAPVVAPEPAPAPAPPLPAEKPPVIAAPVIEPKVEAQPVAGVTTAAVPTIRQPETTNFNAMESQQYRAAINKQLPTIDVCTKSKAGDGTLNVMLRFEVNPDGTLSTASANTGSGQGKLAACLIKTVRLWSFPPPPTNERIRFAYPIVIR